MKTHISFTYISLPIIAASAQDVPLDVLLKTG